MSVEFYVAFLPLWMRMYISSSVRVHFTFLFVSVAFSNSLAGDRQDTAVGDHIANCCVLALGRRHVPRARLPGVWGAVLACTCQGRDCVRTEGPGDEQWASSQDDPSGTGLWCRGEVATSCPKRETAVGWSECLDQPSCCCVCTATFPRHSLQTHTPGAT